MSRGSRGVFRGCEQASEIYREIISSKNNQKVLENGDIQIGEGYAMSISNSRVYKLVKV